LAGLLLVLILLSNVAINRGGTTVESKVLDPDATTSQPLPTLPIQADTTTAIDSTAN